MSARGFARSAWAWTVALWCLPAILREAAQDAAARAADGKDRGEGGPAPWNN